MNNKIFLSVIILLGLVSNILPQTLFRSGIFLHHSTGGVIWTSATPDVPALINQYNVDNNLTGANSVTLNIDEDFFPSIANGGNFYDTWHAVFVGESDNPVEDALLQQYIEENRIVVIKACWGGSAIGPVGDPSDTSVIDDDIGNNRTYYRTQWHWRRIIEVMEGHPNTFFVIWTGIPLKPIPTSPYDGTIAHQFFLWAKDTLATGLDAIYGDFPANVYVFDAFHLLAIESEEFPWGTAHWGMNPLYHDEGDNHPNEAGANVVAQPLVWETFDAAIAYEIGGRTFQMTVPIQNHWNMVSISGLHPTGQNVSTWWQFRDPGANVFKYAGGYTGVTTAVPGTGYWMKHAGALTYNTGEEWPAGGIQIVAHNPLAGASGWNLIGGYELMVQAANVTTNPPGLQSGPIYKYSSGYTVATTIDPGYGYWIKLTGAGQIIIPETMAKGEVVEYFPEEWGKIVLTDATGINYTLYAVKGEVNLDNYELPPAPMAGMFDIRFSSGRIAEDINSSVKTIDMSGVTYPLTVRVEGMDIRLMDETGKTVNVNIQSGEDIVISDASIMKLMVLGELIPSQYALSQNYPNPFNPSTTIEYQIPELSFVAIKVFDVIGNEITILLNEEKPAGSYEVKFNAEGLSSGIYFYQLRAGDFVKTKKMILIR